MSREHILFALSRGFRRLGFLMVLAVWQAASTPLHAQEIQAGVDFLTVIPKGELRDNIDNNGYGIGGQFLIGIGRSPFLAGIDAGTVRYGSMKTREPFSSTIPEVELELQTDNKIVLTHFLLRVQPRTGNVRPYLDGLVGFKYLFTSTSIRSEFSDEVIASTTNLSDLTFSYGFGGGVQVLLAGSSVGRQICLDGKVRYLRGSEAKYLRRGSIRREGGGVFFDVLSSRTDVVTAQIGVTFRF